jgi:hypothetical protein
MVVEAVDNFHPCCSRIVELALLPGSIECCLLSSRSYISSFIVVTTFIVHDVDISEWDVLSLLRRHGWSRRRKMPVIVREYCT